MSESGIRLKKGRRYFLWYYLIAILIPIGVMTVPFLFVEPMEYGRAMAEATEKLGVEFRGSALWPFVRVALEEPILWIPNIFAAAPAIAAFIVMIVGFGRRGLVYLLNGIRPWRNGVTAAEGVRVWGFMILVMVGFKLLTFAVLKVLGIEASFIGGLDLFSLAFLSFFLQTLFFDQGGLLEEYGWRGFAAPYLQSVMASPLRAAVLLGALWAFWHLPREMAPPYAPLGVFVAWQALFLILSIALTIIINYFYNLVGGSVLIGIAVHGLSNDLVGLGGISPNPHPDIPFLAVRFLLYVPFAALIVWKAGPDLGLRKGDTWPVDAAPEGGGE